MDFKYICSQCGGTNVEVRAWINPNTNEVFDFCSSEQYDCWCNDCEEHYELETIKKED